MRASIVEDEPVKEVLRSHLGCHRSESRSTTRGVNRHNAHNPRAHSASDHPVRIVPVAVGWAIANYASMNIAGLLDRATRDLLALAAIIFDERTFQS